MKSFSIPLFYRSSLITEIKRIRNSQDHRKKDYSPTRLDFGPVQFLIARHFGFCYGVEHAINIAYKAIEENPGRRIFLLSEMIHNPDVNRDLSVRGVRFIMKPSGEQLIPWNELTADDIVIIPAFGTTVEILNQLTSLGIRPLQYDATCPFVQKVWNKGLSIGKDRYTVIIHGKPGHEETRATFSHIAQNAPSLIVRNMEQAERLAEFILNRRAPDTFDDYFGGQHSPGFDVQRDLERIGVVNQTTMLASDTRAISDFLKKTIREKYKPDDITLHEHFAETLDTLCYATHDNQQAVYRLLEEPADLAIVAGGYNSSNTSHLVELCSKKLPTYYIESAENIIHRTRIRHFSLSVKKEKLSEKFLPERPSALIAMTSGASCPDSVVEQIITKIVSFYENARTIEDVRSDFTF